MPFEITIKNKSMIKRERENLHPSMIKFLRDRPWLWIILAFVVLIIAWTFLLKIAGERQPASVELYQHPDSKTTAP